MTIIEHYIGDKTTGAATLEGREYETEVYVRSDDAADTGKAVLDYLVDNGFQYGSTFQAGNDSDDSTRIFQIDRPRKLDGSCYLWLAIVRHKQINAGSREANSSGQPARTPLEFRPTLSISTQIRQVIVDQAKYLGGYDDAFTGMTVDDYYPITNSALVEFVPQPKKDESSTIVRLRRNLASVRFTEDDFPTDWVNKTAITLTDRKTTIYVEPFKMKFLRWTTTPKFEEGVDFVEVTLEVEVRKRSWRRTYLDQGLMGIAQYPGSTGTAIPDGRGGNLPNPPQAGAAPYQKLTDASGNTVSQPVPFNGKGRPKDSYRDFVYSEWAVYDEIDPAEIPFVNGLAR